MKTSNGNATRRNERKFPEPTGWATNWALFDPDPAQEAAWVSACQMETRKNGSNGTCRKFPEPSAWAAQWDGTVLSASPDQNGSVPDVGFGENGHSW
jgi:hypothetical protein